MRSLSVVLGLLLLTGCGHAMNLAAVQDAEAVMRVKTALVNDPVIGLYPIEVRVTGGVATLTGGVRSEADADRAVAIARGVTGITQVRSQLEIGVDLPASSLLPAQQPRTTFLDEEPDFGSLLATGAAVRYTDPSGDRLGSAMGVGPLVRLGSGSGLGVSIGFNWSRSDLSAAPGGADLGCLNVRPVMAGPGYTLRHRRLSTSLSVVGGPAFNSLCNTEQAPGPIYALTVGNSIAWRIGASTWVEMGDRLALNVFTGYLTTRPRLTVLSGDGVESYRLRLDAPVLSAGLVYKVF